MVEFLWIVAVSYLVGSVPNGLLLGKTFWHTDLRQLGSCNIGATNAFRVLGPWPAFCVFLTDAAKGVFGVWLASQTAAPSLWLVAAGIAAIAGHNWSVFLGFKGGRGVATGLGVIAFLVPKVTLIVFAVWALIVWLTRYVSLASIVAAALVPVCMWFLGEEPAVLAFGVLAAVFVIVRHRPNIQRLLKGEESKIRSGKR